MKNAVVGTVQKLIENIVLDTVEKLITHLNDTKQTKNSTNFHKLKVVVSI